MNQDPLADIATSDAVAVWLSDCGLDDLAETFKTRGWFGEALLDADPADLETVVGPDRMGGLHRRLLEIHRKLRFTAKTALNREDLDRSVEACRTLGRDWAAQPWLAAILEIWPGPIAHELYMLGELLKQGKVMGALVQMRDVAEVLIKMPAVIMARDLLVHGSSSAVQARIRKDFFTTNLAMGTWLGLVRDLARAVNAEKDSENELIAPQVAGLFVDPNGKLTDLYKALDAQTTLRNKELAHGALRFDEIELVTTVRHYLLGNASDDHRKRPEFKSVVTLAKGLTFARTVPCWERLTLKIEGADGNHPLIGWCSIRDYHDGAPPASHEERTAAVLVVRPDRTEPLRLAPYLAARTCAMCGHRDVFIFNGWDRRKHRYDLLDYLMGHRMRRNWHQVADLYEESRRQAPPPDTVVAPPDTGLSLTRGSVIALLDDAAFDKRYLSPAYLRKPLRAFLTAAERGLFWLVAPAHAGKSMFVLGLATEALREEQPLLDGLKVVTVFIRREYRYGPGQIAPLLELGLEQVLDVAKLEGQRLPQIDLDAADKPGAFVRCVNEFRTLANFDGKLLIALDGLDELRPPEQGISMLDYLPAPERLPVNSYVLLTSRPRADGACPAWVWQRLGDRLKGQTGFRPYQVTLNDPGYRKLLRSYFDRELGEAKAMLENRLLAAGEEPVTARRDATARFERLFEALVEKAEGLFLYVAFLIDRVKEGDVPLVASEIESLPQRQYLFTAYLDGLADILAPKHWELARSVLLTLAAVEQAHTWYIEGRQPPYAVELEWRGLPLDTLVDLLHQQGAEGDLIYILSRLKAALGSWRGEAAPVTRYRLGLKGLTEAIVVHKRLAPALRATHQRLVREVLALLAPAPDAGEALSASEALEQSALTPPRSSITQIASSASEAPEQSTVHLDPIPLRYVLAHGELSGDETLADEVAASDVLVGNLFRMSQEAYDGTRLEETVRWSTLAVLVQERRSKAGGSDDDRNDLATMYSNRGLALADQGELAGAMADHGEAIVLRERLRDRLQPEDQWSVPWQNDLARAYLNRGVVLRSQGDLAGSVADFDKAIALQERLRDQLQAGGQWPFSWRDELAMAYSNRGAAFADQGELAGAVAELDKAITLQEELRDQLELRGEWRLPWQHRLAVLYSNHGRAFVDRGELAGAVADYDKAITLQERLRDQLQPEDQWPLSWQNDLARAYINRGIALRQQGDLAAAVDDHDEAIVLQERLRDKFQHEGQWPLPWQNELAAAHMYRGVALRIQGELARAVADHSEAIAVLEQLRERLQPGGNWPLGWQEDLAAAYSNRGVALSDQGKLAAAVADYSAAIALRERLRDELQPEGQWPLPWQMHLARVYMNRGAALVGEGELAGAVADWGKAIVLREGLVFAHQYHPAIPEQAANLYNLVLLSDQAELQERWRSSCRALARDFLEKLDELIDISKLPEQWQKELADLYQVVQENASESRKSGGFGRTIHRIYRYLKSWLRQN